MERQLPPMPPGWQPATRPGGTGARGLRGARAARPLLFAVPVALGLGAGLTWTALTPPTYLATAGVVVQPLVADAFAGGDVTSAVSMPTEVEVARSQEVLSAAARTLGTDPASLRAGLDVTAPAGSLALTIGYRAGSADAAARGAQAVAEAYLAHREAVAAQDVDRRLAALKGEIDDVVGRLPARPAAATALTGPYQDALRALLSEQRELTAVKATSGGRLVSPAVAPAAPVSPDPLVRPVLGLLLGAVVGALLALLVPPRMARAAAARPGRPARAARSVGRPGSAAGTARVPGPRPPVPASGPVQTDGVLQDAGGRDGALHPRRDDQGEVDPAADGQDAADLADIADVTLVETPARPVVDVTVVERVRRPSPFEVLRTPAPPTTSKTTSRTASPSQRPDGPRTDGSGRPWYS